MEDSCLVTLFFRAFLSYAASDHPVNLLGYGKGLVDEAVGEDVEMGFGDGEDEVVAVVAAEGEGAVVLAEEGNINSGKVIHRDNKTRKR